MKILFLSGLYVPSLKEEFIQHTKSKVLQDAPNTFQWALIEGLSLNKADFTVLTYPWLSCFPLNYTRSKIPSAELVYEGKVIGRSVSYNPWILYKQYSIERSVEREVLRWIHEQVKENDPFVVLTYTPEPFYMNPLVSLKKHFPQMRIATIVTDLVDNLLYFKENRTFLKRIQCQFRYRNTVANYAYIDKFILLTKQMEQKIPQAIGKSLVVEGIYKDSSSLQHDIRIPHTLLYTGTLQEFAGVKLLVDAFLRTSHPDYRLIICGSGPLDTYIRERALQDHRIDFRGNVSRDEAVRLQKSVSLLINPRQPDGDLTMYSFPSKTMEYLSSGTPMIGYPLEGIPDEYLPHIILPTDFSEQALTNVMEWGFRQRQDELESFGSQARCFILQHKTAEVQVKKILRFLES